MRDNPNEPQNTASERNWYALLTRHQHEKSIALALANKNHEVYLPLYRSARQWKDRPKQIWLPLFPCYLFIREGMDRQLQIVSTPGVIRIVAWGGRPAIIPQSQLDAVRQIVESPFPIETHPFIQFGDRVRVKSGPLMGLEGILTRTKGVARLVVTVEMLGRSAAVEIDASSVESVGPFLVPRAARRISVPA